MSARKTSVIGAVLTTGLLLAQPVIAQENCKAVKAQLEEVHPIGISTAGISTNAGILTGTTFRVFNAPAVATSIPTTVTTGSDWTLTTHQGELKTRNVYLYDLLTGLWSALGKIDPDTSTGRFAGATGVLYFDGRTIGTDFPFTYFSNVAGVVCFATAEDAVAGTLRAVPFDRTKGSSLGYRPVSVPNPHEGSSVASLSARASRSATPSMGALTRK